MVSVRLHGHAIPARGEDEHGAGRSCPCCRRYPPRPLGLSDRPEPLRYRHHGADAYTQGKHRDLRPLLHQCGTGSPSFPLSAQRLASAMIEAGRVALPRHAVWLTVLDAPVSGVAKISSHGLHDVGTARHLTQLQVRGATCVDGAARLANVMVMGQQRVCESDRDRVITAPHTQTIIPRRRKK